MIFRRSITATFIAAVLAVLFLGQTAGTAIFVVHSRSALLGSLEARISRAGAVVAGVSAGPLLSYDYSLIDKFIDEIGKDPDIASIRILDDKGKVVRERVNADRAVAKSASVFGLAGQRSLNSPVLAGSQRLGNVVIDYRAHSISEIITRNLIVIALSQGVLLIAVSILLVSLFRRNVTDPVAMINQSVEKITAGDLTAEVPRIGENEIGSIARGISFLEERLSQTISRLGSTAKNVLTAIKQVEHTFSNVTAGMRKQGGAVREVMRSTQNSAKAQQEISGSTERLSDFSNENVSSLLEMKVAAEEIAVNTQRLFRATENSYSLAVQMTQTAKSIAGNAGDVFSAVEDTSAAVEEVGTSVKEVSGHARESSRLAEKVKELTASAGMMSVVNAAEGMEKISEEVRRSSEIIQRLGVRSGDIEKVLSVIRDVTEQTNLLSLNAAILAAQAGEYGKSFSVVADEIRALSERTSTSTREIGGIVKSIQRDIRDAVDSVETTQRKVVEGNSLVMDVGGTLREILDASTHSADMTKAIERATEEQSLGLRQISAAVESIRSLIKHVANATSEQESAVSYLLEGVGEIKEVAEISKRGATEQAEGTKLISRNIELANDRVRQINEAITNHKRMNLEIASAMEQINAIGSSTITDMDAVSVSLKTLVQEIETLRIEMESFRTA